MTEADFNEAVSRTRLKARSVRIARMVLLDGLSPAAAARSEGVTHETARQAAARVLREYRNAGGYPRDWQAVTVIVPDDLAEEIRNKACAARKAAGIDI